MPEVLRVRPDKTDASYAANYEFAGEFIDERHRDAHALVADVEGWLLEADALKLYELAYFTPGPVLEIGSYHGKSSILMSRALQDAGRGTFVLSLDVDPEALAIARGNAARLGAAPTVLYLEGSAHSLRRALRDLSPRLVFVDGLHSYEGVTRDLRALEPVLPRGAVIAFHDYVEPEAGQERPWWYRVHEAVQDSWVVRECEFAGTSGACGVFVRRDGPPGADDAPELASLLRLSAPGARLRRRLAAAARAAPMRRGHE